MMRSACLVVLLLAASPRLEALSARSAPPDPEQVLDEQVENIRTVLRQNRVDPARDGMLDILTKKQNVRQAVSDASTAVVTSAFDLSAVMRHVVTLRNDTHPRLSGRVIHVGPDQVIQTLRGALLAAAPGDLILLDEGEYELGMERRGPYRDVPQDVAIVGLGPERTTLLGTTVGSAPRTLLEGLRIECRNSPITDFRSNGAFMLRNCRITGYNSGAGGSNALSASGGSILFIERCIFDGWPGRSTDGGRLSSGGVAFDLRGDFALFVRHSQFLDNFGIVHATGPVVFDGCINLNREGRSQGISPHPVGLTLVRENRVEIHNPNSAAVREFTIATDDPPFVEFVAGRAAAPSAEARDLAAALQLERSLPYWIGLIRHEDASVRAIAVERVRALAGVTVADAEPNAPNESLRDLGAIFRAEVEAGRLLNWWDSVRARLKWDDAAGVYRERPVDQAGQ